MPDDLCVYENSINPGEAWYWQRIGESIKKNMGAKAYSAMIRDLGDCIAALTLQEAQELSDYLVAKI